MRPKGVLRCFPFVIFIVAIRHPSRRKRGDIKDSEHCKGTMEWQPGHPSPQDCNPPVYDQNDPWVQRFVSQGDNGQLNLDVKAMNGLEAAAGAMFVNLIREHADRCTPLDYSSGTGLATGHSNPYARKVDRPMTQYEPFRITYVRDPRCTPQLRFANVIDAGADHHEREAFLHWRRGGRTWSRVPRFREGETAFTYDPNFKPGHSRTKRWYNTEAGSKVTLAGRIGESRWQSSLSMQSGREPKEPSKRSRLPRPSRVLGPGPTSYHLQDPWQVKHVCGQIPKSRMFCEPVARRRPRTTAPPPRHFSLDASSGRVLEMRPDLQRRPCTTSAAKRSTENAFHTWSSNLRKWENKQNNNTHGDPVDTPYNDQALAPGVAALGPPSRRRADMVGPVSFARAERLYVSDEPRRREESYGKHIVRLPTTIGDVVATVNRRRVSTWGCRQPSSPPDRGTTTAVDGAATGPGGASAPKLANRRWDATGERQGPQAVAAPHLPGSPMSLVGCYREPGREELPVVFRGTSAPLFGTDAKGARRSSLTSYAEPPGREAFQVEDIRKPDVAEGVVQAADHTDEEITRVPNLLI